MKDARLKYSKSSTEEEKFSFQLIVNKGRNRPRLSLFFTCESDASWRQWVDDLENTLIAYHRQTEYSKVLGWFHDIIQGNGFSAAYLGDIAELRRHIRAAVDSPLGAPGSKAETMLLNILDQPDRTGMTALHWAALRGHEVCVRMLLDRGAEVDVLQKGMNSPFLLAAAGGHETVARLLLERGAELSLQNHKGHDAVFMAVLFGHASKGLPWLLQLLTHRGIDLNQVDSAGATPLHLCAEKNLARPIRMLVDAGADVNAKYGQNQMSPLQLACKQRIPDVETIRSFLDKGAYPNWRDLSGRTAFEIALSMQPQATSRRQSFGSPTKSNSARFTVDAADNVPPSPHQSQSNDSVTAPAATDRWRSMEETLSQVGDWAVRALPALLELCKKGARFELKDIEFLRQSFRAAVLEARDVWASKAPPTNFREFVTAREQAGEKLLLHKGVWHKDKASATCPLCSDGFGLTNRRHHCRACGVLCCDRCSSKRMMLCGLGERSESSNDLMPASPSAANSNNAFKEERVCDGCFNRLSHEASLPSPDNFRVRQLKQCALDAIQSIEELIESLDDPYGDPNNFQASLRETQQLTRDLSKVSFSTGTTAVASASRSMYGSMSSVTSVRGARLQAQFGSDGASNTSLPRASGEALVEALKIRDSRLYRAEDVVAKFLEVSLKIFISSFYVCLSSSCLFNFYEGG